MSARRAVFETAAVSTRFTDLVGCRLPIQLAGLGGGIGTPALALAVARAGGLGLIGQAYSAVELAAVLDAAGDPAPGRVGVNFLVPFVDDASVEAAATRSTVIDFFYGDPDRRLIERAHDGGALVSWQVGDADEARAAEDRGCDLVVAQGVEAGGHVRGKLMRAEVLDDVLNATSVPVLSAGGIATRDDVVAVLRAGADGVRVGTRFVATEESGAHPDYIAALIAADGGDTELTTRFDADWPDAPHRVLRACIDAAANSDEPRWSSQPPTVDTIGDINTMALYAGTGVGAVRSRMRAADVVAELMTE